MKPVRFLADSLKCLRAFPDEARHDAGYQIGRLQQGLWPRDYKPMPSIGQGVEEIRVRDGSGVFRVIYTARIAEAVFVLHAFQQKTQATSKSDIELAKTRLEALLKGKTV